MTGHGSYIHVSVWLPQSEGTARIIARALAKLRRGRFPKLEGGYREEEESAVSSRRGVSAYLCAPICGGDMNLTGFIYVVHYTAMRGLRGADLSGPPLLNGQTNFVTFRAMCACQSTDVIA